jgi:hypothetical protein
MQANEEKAAIMPEILHSTLDINPPRVILNREKAATMPEILYLQVTP